MNKSLLLQIGKWLLIALFTSINFFFYLINETSINLIVLLLVIVYSAYEFYQIISKHKVNKLILPPLYIVFFFIIITILFLVQNFILANYKNLLINMVQIIVYIILIIYLIRRFGKNKNM